MAETLFPNRQRCKKCRGKLDSTVLLGLYCSYKCSEHPAPSTDVDKAPRECAYTRSSDNVTVFKRKFRCESEIPDNILSKPDVSVYWCSYCQHLHTGTAVARTVKDSKHIRNMEELSEVLVKSRGNATRATVGKVAGVRPIRIKELEEGADKIDADALFALLKLYRLSLSVGFN